VFKDEGKQGVMATASYLIALSDLALTRDKLNTYSSRLAIAQLGVRYKGKQRIEITRPMMSDMVKNFRKRDTGEVPIDYDHAIEIAAGSGEPVPASGWIKAMDDGPDDQGILWCTVQWTQRAAAMIRAKEYRYVSPVIDPTVRDNKTGEAQGWTLTSAALTNTPVLQGMPALVLSEAGWVSEGRKEQEQVSNDWDGVQVEISQRVKQVMAARGLSHAAAFQRLMLDDRDLWQRYQEARFSRISTPGVRRPDDRLAAADSEILPLVREKMAASEGKMAYRAALNLVLTERPDLARRRMDAIR